MKSKIILLVVLSFFVGIFSSTAQIEKHVKWSAESKKISADEALITIKAKIDPSWHLYGQFFADGGPIQLKFNYEASSNYQLVGKTSESPKPKEVYDEIFEMKINYFSNTATFTQKIKLKSQKDFEVKVLVEGQTCIDDGRCVPEESELTIKVEGATATPKEEVIVAEEEVVKNKNDLPADSTTTEEKEKNIVPITNDKVDNSDNEESEFAVNSNEGDEKKSLWRFFFIAFGAGFITLLTPCVFPIIPMTVSFFMNDKKKSKARAEAIVYGISIVLIYTLPIAILTLLTAFLGANIIEADFANTMSTHWIPNILFTIVFLFFAASFFGLFEIVLPSALVNKADKQADKGGFTGAFFMAFTLVLVSFSCTGPIVGTIIVNSLTGLQVEAGVDYSFFELLVQYGEPSVGMLGYSLGIALPFTLFAMFPKWLDSMPKSGGWLNAVKVVLGFVELALALKFLGVSDQAYHWGLLDREVYIALWIVIFSLMGLYLLGKIKFAHDTDMPYVGVMRLTLAILTFSFVVYLIPGMFGAPLKGLSGYLPPMSTHDFNLVEITREHSNSGASNEQKKLCNTPKYADFLHLPHGLKGYFDYEEGMKCAKAQNKPVFIDFTGHGCVNCRKMEANVWSDPAVLKRLQNDYIIITLYVDDKKELPEDQWITSKHDGRIKKTIGKINADFQVTKFGVNAQPYYVLLDSNGEKLAKPRGFDLDSEKFVHFLDYGLKEFSVINK